MNKANLINGEKPEVFNEDHIAFIKKLGRQMEGLEPVIDIDWDLYFYNEDDDLDKAVLPGEMEAAVEMRFGFECINRRCMFPVDIWYTFEEEGQSPEEFLSSFSPDESIIDCPNCNMAYHIRNNYIYVSPEEEEDE